MLSKRGIELNLDKCRAILEMQTPNIVKDIKKLNGHLAILMMFVAKLVEKALPFFKILKRDRKFNWTGECEFTFQQFKEILLAPRTLNKVRSRRNTMCILFRSWRSNQHNTGEKWQQDSEADVFHKLNPSKYQVNVPRGGEGHSSPSIFRSEITFILSSTSNHSEDWLTNQANTTPPWFSKKNGNLGDWVVIIWFVESSKTSAQGSLSCRFCGWNDTNQRWKNARRTTLDSIG